MATRGLAKLFEDLGRPVPGALATWEDRVDGWCSEYRGASTDSEIVEINLGPAVYLFDLTAERVVLAYAVSVLQNVPRDLARMRGFPDVNVSVKAVTGREAFPADRGHFLSHATGGGLDINLFPQQRDLNRGWSPEGKTFRQMERFTASRPGTFFYHRPLYDDPSWVPACLEFGILREESRWWVRRFQNKRGSHT